MGIAASSIFLLISIAACGSGDRGRANDHTVVDTLPGGTIVVRNSDRGRWTDVDAWRLEETVRLGDEGEGPELFGEIAGLELGPDGSVYVLERQAKEVRAFAPDGRFVRAIGRQGSGPGEFRDPIAIRLDPSGRLWVVDPGNSRYTVFGQDGELVATHLRPIAGYAMPWPGQIDRDGRLYDRSFLPTEERVVIVRFDSAMVPRDTMQLPPAPRQETFELQRGNSRTFVSVPFTPRARWEIDIEGRVWYALSSDYRFLLLGQDGDTSRIIERSHRRLPVTADDRAAALQRLEWFTSDGGRLDESRIPAEQPAISLFHVADDGFLWVRPTRPRGAEGVHFDVFDPDGRYLGAVISDQRISSYPPPRITSETFLGVVVDELDVASVVRFRIVKPAPAR